MKDKIRIWETDDGLVHYELTDEDGTIFCHTAMSAREWYYTRNDVLKGLPGNVTLGQVVDYLAVLMNEVYDIRKGESAG